ncbi:MAG: hypothetical protein J07HQW2_02718 [Haloquadratum walsbyi J07HQW2]|uniref:Transposase n=1 Tax=Haloquadratum walsbyi J07HQW2 TaxID=1238425 RepID=U1NH91_9EURY|nr:MAG: hypothetical protein J07HQW2_02718 [Haloquadratum walsbyi J07HQW2]
MLCSLMLDTTCTYVAKITNHQQVRDDLDACGFSASKLWNVGRYYIQEQWDETGEIPEEDELKSTLKNHERYTDLHSHSTQREFLKNLLRRSADGTIPMPMTATTHRDTENVVTTTHAQQSHGKKVSDTTQNTGRSDCLRGSEA